ncbi:MAG TPA: endonuclease, partial [Phycisphaerales bacterium]|nr:endonuclease [Phycisphaerales bacterium]
MGKRGEKVAHSYLRKAGWRCIAKNVRFGKDELDILAMTPDERTLVIVEVRSTAIEHKKPEHTIDRAKRTTMLRIAK